MLELREPVELTFKYWLNNIFLMTHEHYTLLNDEEQYCIMQQFFDWLRYTVELERKTMNDCAFKFIEACPYTYCPLNCPKYTSANCNTGLVIIDDFTERVEKAVEPIRTEIRNKYFEVDG